jgi:hypothetical protein
MAKQAIHLGDMWVIGNPYEIYIGKIVQAKFDILLTVHHVTILGK